MNAFLTKDDINDNCSIPRFVATFLSRTIADIQYQFRFEAAFMENRLRRIQEDPLIVELMKRVREKVETGRNQLTAYKQTEEDEKMRAKFVSIWKTFNDQSGYIKGKYITYFSEYS